MSEEYPCTKCRLNNGGTCGSYQNCKPWKNQYFKRQKQINAYAEIALPVYHAASNERYRELREKNNGQG